MLLKFFRQQKQWIEYSYYPQRLVVSIQGNDGSGLRLSRRLMRQHTLNPGFQATVKENAPIRC